MIQDISSRDVQKLINQFIGWLYKKSIDYFDEQFLSIAQRNQQAKQSPVFTFTFGGKVYKYESEPIRFPQSLAKELIPEMHELVRRRQKIVDEEGAYARQAMIAACGRCDSVSHLYELLPSIVHPYLELVGVARDLDPNFFSPLPEKLVMEFKTSQASSLAKIKQRITRNALGVIK